MNLLVVLTLIACGGSSPEPAPVEAAPAPAEEPAVEEAPAEEATADAGEVPPAYASMFSAVEVPAVAPTDKAKVELGRMLYYDTRLSKGRDISCNSCHVLTNFGVDNQPTSPGHEDQRGARNSPTVYNAAGHFVQFWDGRAADVEEQALGPILNPVEMAMPDADTVVKLLTTIPGYEAAFARAYPDAEAAVTWDHVGDAIGTFERHLVTPSPFDAWLKGDTSAMTAEQREGLDAFVSTGCTACHSGPFLGGSMYMKLGQVVPYETEDVGRMEVTGNEADRFMFKVPSLRNIEHTGPYFHDGSIASLDEAVKLMAKHQLGKELDDETTGKIVTFLGALTGEVDKAYIAEPVLPEDGPETASIKL